LSGEKIDISKQS